MVLRRPETSATNSFFLNLFNVFLSKENVFMSIMQTFAQSNCVFTPRFALTYKYLA